MHKEINTFFIQPLKYIFLLFIVFVLYELINVDNKYINKPTVTFDLNNVRNPQIKKITRYLDNKFGQIYFNISKKKQEEFYNNNLTEYENLPSEITISAKKIKFTISDNKNFNNNKTWTRSHGNHSSNKFSNLNKVNRENVNKLKLAWEHNFNSKSSVPGNPIFFDNKVFVSSTNKSLLALDINNGKKIWEHKTEGKAAVRGLMIDNNKDPRIYFCDQFNLISLNPNNGEFNKDFGNNGKINLKHKCHVTPIVVGKEVVIATFEPGIEVYDLDTGKIKWKYYLKEKNNFFRYGGKRYDFSGGNVWGGISADINRKIIYISTGNAGRFYAGVSRPGNNKYSNSIIAIDLKNKKLLWEFQEIEHDIWNYDIASPPILTNINKEGKLIDVVVTPTKYGNTLVLDRLTGESIFDYKNIKVPQSDIDGEKTAFYQKKFLLPEPFSRQFFKEKDISSLFPDTKNFIENKIKGATYGFFIPNSLNKKNIIYKGGAQWMGASINNKSGIMYLTSNDIPAFIWLEKTNKENTYYKYKSNFKVIKDQRGYPASKPPWGKLTAINLNSGKIIWSIPFGEYEELTEKGIPITGTINYGGATATAGNLVFATGTIDKKIRAFDSTNGEELWNYKMDYSGSSPPTIIEHNNEQYIIVVATGSNSINDQFPNQHEFGNKVYAFKLEK
jgi:quinoprotein glucose dehydrogenase